MTTKTRLPLICMAGLQYKDAPIALREALALDKSGCRQLLGHLREHPGISEAVAVSTCNRTELYAVCGGTVDLCGLLLDFAGIHHAGARTSIYQRSGPHAIEHLFRVIAGLESLVLGENQIVGQIKEAYALAGDAHSVGTIFHRLFHQAFRAGKRSRTETGIGRGSVSIGSAAVDCASQLIPDLPDRQVLLIGAGAMAQAVVMNLKKIGAHGITVTNRTPARAEALARAAAARILPFDELPDALAAVDLAVCATAAPAPVVRARDIAARSPNRPLHLIDIAMPRNIEPAAGRVAGVHHYDLDGLRHMIEENMCRRRAEVPAVERIVREEVESFASWCATLAATPTIRRLQEHVERIRQREVSRCRKHFGEDQWDQIEAFSRSLTNKILHRPIMSLKQCSGPDTTHRHSAIREVFGLDEH